MATPHFLLVAFPSQGHINPALEIAKRLLRLGAQVTFSTAISAYRRMAGSKVPTGLTFANFSDGSDDHGFDPSGDMEVYMAEIVRKGSETLREQILANDKEGRKFTCIIYTTMLPWVANVARSLHLPSTLIWTQPATVLDIYYYYFNGYGDLIINAGNHPSSPINLPGLPTLLGRDVPSFFNLENQYAFTLPLMKQQFDNLKEETNPKVLINTFDALESGPLKAIDKLNMVGIGPLLPSAFLDGQDPSDKSFGGDLFKGSKDYIKWLDTKPEGSVIYVSFGSISVLSKQQRDEMARGLLATEKPFLWVIRETNKEEMEEEGLSCREELERQGMIVPWCSQVEVLSHPATGCFVTHCGWNSTFESLTCGVPMVAFPQWTDQNTNAKLVEDLWKVGVRVNKNEKGIVEGDEIRICLELVIGGGEKSEQIKRNARKWKELAREAGKEGGSSDKNLKAFVEEMKHANATH